MVHTRSRRETWVEEQELKAGDTSLSQLFVSRNLPIKSRMRESWESASLMHSLARQSLYIQHEQVPAGAATSMHREYIKLYTRSTSRKSWRSHWKCFAEWGKGGSCTCTYGRCVTRRRAIVQNGYPPPFLSYIIVPVLVSSHICVGGPELRDKLKRVSKSYRTQGSQCQDGSWERRFGGREKNILRAVRW